jgi:hypothetical protein
MNLRVRRVTWESDMMAVGVDLGHVRLWYGCGG